jgi:GTPase SAR1 family protein
VNGETFKEFLDAPVPDRLPEPMWQAALSVARTVSKGQSVLVVGPSGSGKSSVLRLALHTGFLEKYQLVNPGIVCAGVTGPEILTCEPAEFWSRLIVPQIRAAVRETDLEKRLERFDSARLDAYRLTESVLHEMKRAGKTLLVAWDDFDWHVENPRLDDAFFRKARSLSQTFDVTYLLTSRKPFHDFPRFFESVGSPFPNIFCTILLPIEPQSHVAG